ncbi:hypothetical protein E8E11_006672 [Didymella keratinophila]|nr:hypothetical protein E8E11_006672 [Didymella keratinophila]
MPSQEAKLLSDFLLAPAPLRDFMTLRQFTDIFPRSHRENTAVQDLYRELHQLREAEIEVVRNDITKEVKRSKQLRRAYARERRQMDDAHVAGTDPVALQMEEELSGHGRKTPHTLQTVHSSIEDACQSLEAQIAEMEEENQRALAEVQEAVGALSDLRSGRFAQPASGEDLGEEVLATLKRLEAVYEIIRAIVRSRARVIRLHIQPDSHHNDPEVSIGEFDKSLLDQFDDTLAAIHRISEGQVKVIIAPHDAHALRDFYSLEEYRTLYKTRLDVFFKHYPSKNFGGRTWNELSEIIMARMPLRSFKLSHNPGVDTQNQPFSGIWPIPAGESWLCDIANHLKFSIGLDNSNIAVISGGISGFQSLDGIQNFPDSAFDCPAIDIIGIHGRFAAGEGVTAGTSWAEMFVPGNTLTSRAQGKGGKRKLLLVEEWDYVHTDAGLEHKGEAIFDQGNALNLRGIPWIYSHLSSKNESTTSMINPLHPEHDSMTVLSDVLTRASTGYCNDHGRCDYGGKKKLIFGPGIRGRWKNNRVNGVPEGHERGPAKVRSEALRVVIPTEGVMETGQAKVVS